MTKPMNKFFINIDDWSGDGHGKCDRFLFESNYTVAHLQAAYKESCKKTKIRLHEICSDYEDSRVEPGVAKKLIALGCDENMLRNDEAEEYWEENNYGLFPESMARLLVWFISLSLLKDFECNRTDEQTLNFNVFWGGLNEGFGYGLYYG